MKKNNFFCKGLAVGCVDLINHTNPTQTTHLDWISGWIELKNSNSTTDSSDSGLKNYQFDQPNSNCQPDHIKITF